MLGRGQLQLVKALVEVSDLVTDEVGVWVLREVADKLPRQDFIAEVG